MMQVIIKSLDDLSLLNLNALPKNLEERLRIKNNKHSFRQSRSAYCLLLETLEREYSITNPDIQFTAFGKPYIQNGPHFSISHSGEFVAVAVSDNEVGIDIEEIGEYSPAIADKYCSAAEKEFIEGGDKNLNFFKLWTAKEALLKLRGTGIRELSNTELIPTFDGFRHKNNIIKTKMHRNCVISVCFNEKTGF